MTRLEIYENYLQNGDTCIDHVGTDYIAGFLCKEYCTYDTHVIFYTCSKVVTIDGSKNEHSGVKNYKINLPQYVHRHPIIEVSIIVKIENKSDSVDFVLDFSGSDLSNVISFDIVGDTDYVDLIMPEDKAKRLKPVVLGEIFGHRCRDMVKILKAMDLSELTYASSLFKDSNIEEIDINEAGLSNVIYANCMFQGCKKLRRVTGKMNADAVYATNMFFNCHQLEYVDERLFDGVNLVTLHSIFYCCVKLKNIPIKIDNIIKNIEHYKSAHILSMLSGCNSINSKELMKLQMDVCEELVKFKNNSIKLGNSILNVNMDYFDAGRIKLSNKCIPGLFHMCNIKCLDMSEIDIDDCRYDMIDLFYRCSYTVSEIDEGRVDSYYKNTRGLSDRKVIEKFNRNIRLRLLNIPDVVIINDKINFNEFNRKIFIVVDMRGSSKDEVYSKVKLSTMMGGKKTTVIIA